MYKSKRFKLEHLLLLSVIAIGTALRLINLSQPPIEWFPTRQAMDADIIRTYYRNETSFFYPIVHNFVRPGHLLQEFPLLWWGIAQLMRFTGVFSTSVARLVIIAFYPILSLGIYKLQSLFFREKLMRLLPVLVLTILPLSLIQSRSIQPEIPMITMIVWSIVFWVMYSKQQKFKFLMLAILFGGLAIVLKINNIYLLCPMVIVGYLSKSKRVSIFKGFLLMSLILFGIWILWWLIIVPPIRATTPSNFDAVWRKDFVLSMFLIYSRDYLFWKGLLDNLVVATTTNVGVVLLFLSIIYWIMDFRKKNQEVKIYNSLIASWGLSAGLMLIVMSGNSLQEYYFTSLLPPVVFGISYSMYKIIFSINNRRWRCLIVFILLSLISWRSYLFVKPKLALGLDKQSLLINEVREYTDKNSSLVLMSYTSPPLHGFYLDHWTMPINFLPTQMTERDLAEYKYLSDSDSWINKSPKIQLEELIAKNYEYLVITDLETFENEKEFKKYVLDSFCLLLKGENGYIFQLTFCI